MIFADCSGEGLTLETSATHSTIYLTGEKQTISIDLKPLLFDQVMTLTPPSTFLIKNDNSCTSYFLILQPCYSRTLSYKKGGTIYPFQDSPNL